MQYSITISRDGRHLFTTERDTFHSVQQSWPILKEKFSGEEFQLSLSKHPLSSVRFTEVEEIENELS